MKKQKMFFSSLTNRQLYENKEPVKNTNRITNRPKAGWEMRANN